MGVRITSQEDKVAIFDSVTDTAFGPVFPDAEEAQSFLDYLRFHGYDGREVSSKHLETLHGTWYGLTHNDDGVFVGDYTRIGFSNE